MSVTVQLQIGGLTAKPLREQLAPFGLPDRLVSRFQAMSDGITLLAINEVLTRAEAQKAMGRLYKQIVAEVKGKGGAS